MRVLVLFGGRSGEHEVSVVSARSVVDALEALGHAPVGIGISPSGRWVRADPREVTRVPESGDRYALSPEPSGRGDVDVVFPALHGPYGEDGCVQGLFELADLPYVGAGLAGSVIGMDKVVHKRLFAAAELPVVEFVGLTRREWEATRPEIALRVEKLGYPCFAKPAHLGSSVGISKVRHLDELDAAVERALRHDDLVLVEAFGGEREVEVGVIEDPGGSLDVSVPGEVLVDAEFYDYRAKYRPGPTRLLAPADLPAEIRDAIRTHATTAFRVARCEGFARVDFFYDTVRGLVVNEINSVPGLTPTSMFPRVWEASGVPFREVVRRLLAHAQARHERKAALEAARAASHEEEVS